MPVIDKDLLCRLFSRCGLPLGGEMADRFCSYAELLCEWNEKMNLTAITDPEGIVRKHFLDSCLPLSMVDIKQGATLIDVGTGAGFPAIPLKILRPDLQVTLLDSLNKRLVFLSQVCQELGISADIVHGRAEECAKAPSEKSGGKKQGRSSLRETRDYAVARAVAGLGVLCEYCLPYVKPGGSFIALKGADGESEANEAARAVKELGGTVESVIRYDLPSADGSKGDARTLIVIKKIARTPDRYPRTKAKMDKFPL